MARTVWETCPEHAACVLETGEDGERHHPGSPTVKDRPLAPVREWDEKARALLAEFEQTQGRLEAVSVEARARLAASRDLVETLRGELRRWDSGLLEKVESARRSLRGRLETLRGDTQAFVAQEVAEARRALEREGAEHAAKVAGLVREARAAVERLRRDRDEALVAAKLAAQTLAQVRSELAAERERLEDGEAISGFRAQVRQLERQMREELHRSLAVGQAKLSELAETRDELERQVRSLAEGAKDAGRR